MKKTFLIPLSVLTIGAILGGCANSDSTVDIAKHLDKNLNNLSYVVRKLDVVDNGYIANPDLKFDAKQLSGKTSNGRSFSLAFNENENSNISNEQINQLIQQLLYNKLSQSLTQKNNGTCRICNNQYSCENDGFCNFCHNKIICDNHGNCTNCGSHLNLDQNNTCANCHSSAVIGEKSCRDAVKQLSSHTDEDLVATRLSTKNIINNIKNDKSIFNDELTATQLNTNQDIPRETYTHNEHDENGIRPMLKSEGYKFKSVKYSPRHFDNIDDVDITNQIDMYINKVQKLYAMSSDTVEANSILKECKEALLDTVADVKQLNKEVINGTCVPNQQQVMALKNYIDEIKLSVKKLKSCNGQITNQVNKIDADNSSSMTSSVDLLSSNYITLLNQLDTRITYHESAISTLEQIKYLLEEAIANKNLDVNTLEDYNNKLNNIENKIVDDNTLDETENQTDDKQANNFQLEDETYLDNTTNTDNEQVDTSTQNASDVDNEEYTDTTTTPTEPQTNTTEQEVNNDNLNDSNTDKNEQQSDSKLTNTDTYKNNNLNNIDTYKKQNNNQTTKVENKQTNNYDEYVNNQNSQVEENEDVNQNTILNDDNNIVYDNNISANAENNTMYDNTSANYQNQNGMQNGVIYQNNLNTGSNVQHRYYYGDDGKVHNSTNTIDNSFNGQGNSGVYNNGVNYNNGIPNNNTSNNVNTYGYNSMLDVINQGTVNNSINTL